MQDNIQRISLSGVLQSKPLKLELMIVKLNYYLIDVIIFQTAVAMPTRHFCTHGCEALPRAGLPYPAKDAQ